MLTHRAQIGTAVLDTFVAQEMEPRCRAARAGSDGLSSGNVGDLMLQLSLSSEPMWALVRKSQVGTLLMAWWMFMAVTSLGALQ